MLPYESKYHFSTKKVLMMFKGRKCVVQAWKWQKIVIFSIELNFMTQNINLKAGEYIITLGDISNGLCHRNRFTRSSAYKLGLKSPILA